MFILFYTYGLEGIFLIHNCSKAKRNINILALLVSHAVAFALNLFRVTCYYGITPYFSYSLRSLTAAAYIIGFLIAINGIFIDKFQQTDRMAKELSDLNETLEMKVIEKTEELSVSYEQLKQVKSQRETFLMNIVHDIKTRLFSISGYTEMLKVSLEECDDQAIQYVDILAENEESLQKVVENMFITMRLEDNTIAFQMLPFNICNIVRQTVQIMQPVAERAGIDLKYQVPDAAVILEGDAEYLQRALQNLIDNGIANSLAGSRILVTADVSGHTICLSVLDQGEGIAPEDMEHIFERFYSKRTNGRKSSGLGLTIVKTVIEAHHGEIRVESQIHQGTLFEIYLPLVQNK